MRWPGVGWSNERQLCMQEQQWTVDVTLGRCMVIERANECSRYHTSTGARRGLQTATTTTTLTTGRVRGSGGGVLNAANGNAGTGKGTQGGLATGTGGLGLVATDGTHANVQGVDAQLLAANHDILGSQHRSVRRRLIAIGLHLLATRHVHQGFLTTEISDMNKGVVESSVNVANAKDKGALGDLGAIRHFNGSGTFLLGSHSKK
mmetsp:Transcript_14978/g.46861  ORF Transcript_14978/g.46861 Transcript_14978/m.46861 type:complete len:205 (+) Transcript_14978:113-727(+)